MATLITADNFAEELAPFPGWVFRNLMLLRHLDEKETQARTRLANLQTEYLNYLHSIPVKKRVKLTPEDLSREDEITTDPKLREIIELQRECTALSHEKLAVVAKVETLVKGTNESLLQAAAAIPNVDGFSVGNGPTNDGRDTRRNRARPPPVPSSVAMEEPRATTRTLPTRASALAATHAAAPSTRKRGGGSTVNGGGSEFMAPSSAVGVGDSLVNGRGNFGGDSVIDTGYGGSAINLDDGAGEGHSCTLCNEPDNDGMVSCDGCKIWYHFGCVNYDEAANFDAESYYCPKCTSSKKSKKKKSKGGSSVIDL